MTPQHSKIYIGIKGGPGSGYHGHIGRHGKRGGSAPSGTSITPSGIEVPNIRVMRLEDLPNTPLEEGDFLEKGALVHDLFKESEYNDFDLKSLYTQMHETYPTVPAKDFIGLHSITTTPPSSYEQDPDYMDQWHKKDDPSGKAIGLYDSLQSTICMHPLYRNIASVLVHELGHHVSMIAPSILKSYKDAIARAMNGIRHMTDPLSEIGFGSGNPMKNDLEFIADLYETAHNKFEATLDPATRDRLDKFLLYQGLHQLWNRWTGK